MDVDEEIKTLITEMQRLVEKKSAEGQTQVTFGTLFKDDRCANIFEALVGTLRAAKKRKIVAYDAEMLLSPMHDNIEITLLKDSL